MHRTRADHLGPLPAPGGREGARGVGVCLDLQLERGAGPRALEQLVDQQRALVARSAVSVAEPAHADLRRRALVGPAGQRRDDFEQRVVQRHELADGGQAAVRLEAVEWPLKRARVSAAADESGP